MADEAYQMSRVPLPAVEAVDEQADGIMKSRCKMVTVKISPQYTVKIPDRFRSTLHAGQEVAISVDAQGRLIITPIEQVRAILQETFGMWADRTDIPKDGVEYMDRIRRGRRLDDLGLRGQ